MTETINMEQRAFLAAQKTIQSAKELPLSVIDANFRTVTEPVFVDEDAQIGNCMTRKFHSLDHIKDVLERTHNAGVKAYVYKLYELQQHGMDLEPTGEKFYHLRYCLRAKE